MFIKVFCQIDNHIANYCLVVTVSTTVDCYVFGGCEEAKGNSLQ